MDIQPVSYRGRTVAACTARRYFLSDEIQQRPDDDPEVIFIIAMAHYARAVALGHEPAPYSDQAAIRYARQLLIPAELLDRRDLRYDACAHWLCVPRDELEAAHLEHHAPGTIDQLDVETGR